MLHPKRAWKSRVLLTALAAVLLTALMAGCGKKNEKGGAPGEGEGDVIATYKDGSLYAGEFDKYSVFEEITNPSAAMYMAIPTFKEQFVKQYITYKSMAARATDKQKEDAQKQIDSFAQQLTDELKSNADLKQQLKDKKVSESDLKGIFAILATGSQIFLAKSEEYKAAVQDADIKAEFDKAPTDYNYAEVRHILVATSDATTGEETRSEADALKRAQDVKAKLEAGGDWNALAKEYSDDPGSKDKGGLYEKTRVSGWVTEFKDAANKQEIGKIGDPVKTDYGYHVIKVESRDVMTYDKLPQTDKDEIVGAIVDAKMNEYQQQEEDALEIKVTLPADPSASPSAAPSASPSAAPSASASASK